MSCADHSGVQDVICHESGVDIAVSILADLRSEAALSSWVAFLAASCAGEYVVVLDCLSRRFRHPLCTVQRDSVVSRKGPLGFARTHFSGGHTITSGHDACNVLSWFLHSHLRLIETVRCWNPPTKHTVCVFSCLGRRMKWQHS